MFAINKTTGDYLWGEMHGDSFVVESGPDFNPNHEVYALDEITLNAVNPVLAAVVSDAVDNPTELDGAYSDTPEARDNVLEEMSADEMHAVVMELGPALVRYAEAVYALDDALADVVEGKW